MFKNLRYLLSMLLIAVFSVSAYAEEETITFSELGYENGADVTSVEGSEFTLTFDMGTNNNAPKYYTTGAALRLYAGNSMTVTANTGKKITNVTLTFGSGDGSNAISVTVDGEEAEFDENLVCDGSEVVYTVGGTSKHRRIASVTVTTVDDGGVVLPTANLSFSETSLTLEDTEVASFETPALSYDVDYDGTITYESDNEEVATVDAETGAVTLTGAPGTAQITATASETENYRGSTASYTITVTGYTNITIADAAVATEGANDVRLNLTDALVTYVSGKYIFVREGDKAVMFYNTHLDLNAGDMLNGSIKMNLSVYNGTPEMTSSAATNLDEVEITSENEVEARQATLADVVALDVLSDYIVVNGISINGTTATDGTNEVSLYNRFGIEYPEFEEDATYTIVGLGAVFNDTKQIFPVSFTKEVVEETVVVGITSVRYATLCTEKALQVPAGVVAYTAKIDEVSGKVVPSVTFNEGDVIPAGESVILEGEENVYEFAVVSADAPLDQENVLHGEVDDYGYTSYGAATVVWCYYLLADGPKGVGFYWGADNGAAFLNNAPKAYLAIPANAANGAKFLLFGEATGINAVEKTVENGVVYDIQGRRVANPTRGLYIVNGKKVVIK